MNDTWGERVEAPVEKIGERVEYVLKNIDRTEMQAVVAMGVLGGFGVATMVVRGLQPETEEEAEALRNVPKAVAAIAATAAVFYLLDIDRKWMTIEGVEKELTKRLE